MIIINSVDELHVFFYILYLCTYVRNSFTYPIFILRNLIFHSSTLKMIIKKKYKTDELNYEHIFHDRTNQITQTKHEKKK